MRFIHKFINHLNADSLYRNSIYLMLSTAIMAFFGFFFWIINARLYNPEQIGIATTLISVIGLIGGFSNLGLNVGLIRFLPKKKNKNELINSSLIINLIISSLLSMSFIIGIHLFSPKLIFLKNNPVYGCIFILTTIALTLNSIIESIFVAFRSTIYIFYKNTLLSLIKLGMPILLIPFGAFGIFISVGLSYITALIFSLIILVIFFRYSFYFSINNQLIKKIGFYSFANYIAGFITNLPNVLLPIIITNKLGASQTAYFYIPMMITNLIYIIPTASTQSLFAEGSHNEERMKYHINKATKITILILTPTIVITLFFGNYILLAFGKNYFSEAFILLRILALSSIFFAINSICGTILKVNNRIKELIIISIICTFLILLFSLLFIKFNLIGIGYAWIMGQFISSIIYLLVIFKKK